jgi:hypothetical protein
MISAPEASADALLGAAGEGEGMVKGAVGGVSEGAVDAPDADAPKPERRGFFGRLFGRGSGSGQGALDAAIPDRPSTEEMLPEPQSSEQAGGASGLSGLDLSGEASQQKSVSKGATAEGPRGSKVSASGSASGSASAKGSPTGFRKGPRLLSLDR